jgi:hypothetical protein
MRQLCPERRVNSSRTWMPRSNSCTKTWLLTLLSITLMINSYESTVLSVMHDAWLM